MKKAWFAFVSLFALLVCTCDMTIGDSLKETLDTETSTQFTFYSYLPDNSEGVAVESTELLYKISSRKSSAEFPLFVRSGYHIVGWQIWGQQPSGVMFKTLEDGTECVDSLIVTPQNTALYAIWAEGDPPTGDASYTVTFYGRDGTTILNTQRVQAGERAQWFEFNDTDGEYGFFGWYTDYDANTDSYTWFDLSMPIYADTSVYSKWAIVRYITYHRNDGVAADGSHWENEKRRYEYGQTAWIDDGSFMFGGAKSGNYFLKWNTRADGTGTDYYTGDTIDNFTENMDLYAVWTTEACTVTLVNSVYPSEKVSKKVGKGAKMRLDSLLWQSDTTFTAPTGYRQYGYATSANATEADSDLWNAITVTADATYYQLWAIELMAHFNWYWDDAQTQESINPISYLYGQPITEPDTTIYGTPWRNGYLFAGWYMDRDCTTPASFPLSATDAVADEYGWQYIHIYAKWEDASALHVSETGSDTTGTGTKALPFATVDRAVQAINMLGTATDCTIYVSGTVRENVSLWNLSATSLTIEGLTGADTDSLNGDTDADGTGDGTTVFVTTNVPVTFKNMTITGGKGIGAGGMYVASGATVTLASGVVITGNSAKDSTYYNGGGVYNGGTLYVSGATITSNEAQNGAGIYNTGTLTLSSGAIKENTATTDGGGIYNTGTLTITGGEISKNNATQSSGGGIWTSAAATITGGTISENVAYTFGGGIHCADAPSGSGSYTVTMSGGTITKNRVTRSTESWAGFGGGVLIAKNAVFTLKGTGVISENTASHGGAGVRVNSNTSTFVMEGGTISENTTDGQGGGVDINGVFTMSGGTISGNTAATVGGGVCFGGTETDIVYALSDDASIPVGDDGKNDVYLADGKYITISGALSATAVANISLPAESYQSGTKVLGDTATLVSAHYTKFSVADDSDGNSWSIASDGTLQLSTLYVAGAGKASDVGTGSDIPILGGNGTKQKPYATLGRAFTAMQQPYDYKIYISGAPWSYMQIADFATTPANTSITKAKSITIIGYSGSSDDAIDGNNTYPCLTVSNIPVIISNVRIEKGKGGGIVANSGSVSISGSYIANNSAENGGGIFVASDASVSVETSSIDNNTATENGGGIYSKGSLIITDCTLSGNNAKNGGGVYLAGGSVSFNAAEGFASDRTRYVKITGNTASQSGGGLYVANGATVGLNYVTISKNTATTSGGGVHNKGTLFMYGSAVIGDKNATTAATASACSNKVTAEGASGGGIYNEGGSVYLGYRDASTESVLTGGLYYNYAPDIGGIDVHGGTLVMKSGNISYHTGRGLYLYNCTATMLGGTISGNISPSHGGGVYAGWNGKFIMNGGTISGNTATTYGGGVAVANSGSSFTMTGGTISGNTATTNGGGVDIETNTFTMSGGTISGNTATTYGGGVYNNGTLTMSGGTISGNTAMNAGGGACIAKNGTAYFKTGCEISGNNAKYGGGLGVYGVTYIQGAQITSNESTSDGGGISVNQNGKCYLESGTISKNKTLNGGGIATSGVFEMSGGTISGNEALKGAGILFAATSDSNISTIRGGLITENTANPNDEGSYGNGGGICVTNSAKVYLKTGCEISGNNSQYGGGIGIYSGETYIQGAKISSNESTKDGGGISNSGTLYLESGTITANKSNIGGGICSNNVFEMTGGTISGNTANSSGGGVYNSGTLTLGDDAYIPAGTDGKNDVFLYTSGNGANKKTVLLASPLSHATVATLTPGDYTTGRPMLTLATGATTTVAANYAKFAVTQPASGTWQIDATGKLQTETMGGITITVPEYSDKDINLQKTAETVSTITFTVDSGYTSYTWLVGSTVQPSTTNTFTLNKSAVTTAGAWITALATDASGTYSAKTFVQAQ